MMKVIDAKDLMSINSGSNGRYYRLKGTKIGFKTTRSLAKAKLEFVTLTQASQRSRMIPKGYGLAKAFLDGKWQFGYLMDHIDGDEIPYERWLRIKGILRSTLVRVGIHHGDFHYRNVLSKKTDTGNKYFVIDMDPFFVKILDNVANCGIIRA